MSASLLFCFGMLDGSFEMLMLLSSFCLLRIFMHLFLLHSDPIYSLALLCTSFFLDPVGVARFLDPVGVAL